MLAANNLRYGLALCLEFRGRLGAFMVYCQCSDLDIGSVIWFGLGFGFGFSIMVGLGIAFKVRVQHQGKAVMLQAQILCFSQGAVRLRLSRIKVQFKIWVRFRVWVRVMFRAWSNFRVRVKDQGFWLWSGIRVYYQSYVFRGCYDQTDYIYCTCLDPTSFYQGHTELELFYFWIDIFGAKQAVKNTLMDKKVRYMQFGLDKKLSQVCTQVL